MEYSVNGISSSSVYGTSRNADSWLQRKQGFSALDKALDNGNIAQAQQAYMQVMETMPTLTQKSMSAEGPDLKNDHPLVRLGKSLQEGNIAGAQAALTEMRPKGQSVQERESNSAAAPQPSGQISGSQTLGVHIDIRV